MNINKFSLFLLFIILLEFFVAINYSFDNFVLFNDGTKTFYNVEDVYEKYLFNIELGGCVKTDINKYGYNINKIQFKKYGNESRVDFICSSKYNGLIHSHPMNSICDFSEVDIKTFNKKWTKMSILMCWDRYIIMWKYKNNIYNKTIMLNDSFVEQMLINNLGDYK
jgi:hypothetical protein